MPDAGRRRSRTRAKDTKQDYLFRKGEQEISTMSKLNFARTIPLGKVRESYGKTSEGEHNKEDDNVKSYGPERRWGKMLNYQQEKKQLYKKKPAMPQDFDHISKRLAEWNH